MWSMTHVAVDLNEADLLARMRNFEDHLVDRKTAKDAKDWKKTAVAFANSVPVRLPAVLYIGVRDNGEIETPQPDFDEIQKRLNQRMQRVYPRVFYVPKIIRGENGLQALAVIIPGSELRPHFAGLSYVRRGSESIEASEEQFAELIRAAEQQGGSNPCLEGEEHYCYQSHSYSNYRRILLRKPVAQQHGGHRLQSVLCDASGRHP